MSAGGGCGSGWLCPLCSFTNHQAMQECESCNATRLQNNSNNNNINTNNNNYNDDNCISYSSSSSSSSSSAVNVSLSSSQSRDFDQAGMGQRNADGCNSNGEDQVRNTKRAKVEERPPMESYEFKVEERIESGSFGHTYLGRRKLDGRQVVIKKFNNEAMFRDILDENCAEYECHVTEHVKKYNMEGVVEFLEVVCDKEEGSHSIVMEHLGGGDLFQNIKSSARAQKKFNEREAAEVMFSILNAVDEIHTTARVVHNDLKLENIMFTKQEACIGAGIKSKLKLIDFGLSLIFEQGDDIDKGKVFNLGSRIGTLCCTAPEIRSQKLYSSKSDVWSLGIILCVLLTGTYPFPFPYNNADNLTVDIYDKCFVGNPQLIPYFFRTNYASHISQGARDFILKLLKVNKDERYSIKQALLDPWILQRRNLSEKPFPPEYFVKVKESHVSRKFENYVYIMMFASRIRKLAIQRKIRQTIDSSSSSSSSSNSNDNSNNSSSITSIASGTNVFTSDQLLKLREAFKERVKQEALLTIKESGNGESGESGLSSSGDGITIDDRTLTDIVDNRGVNFESFREVCRSVGLDILAKEFVFNMFDKDSNNKVDYKVFLVALTSFQELSEASLQFYFDLLTDNQKTARESLSVDEFRLLLHIKKRNDSTGSASGDSSSSSSTCSSSSSGDGGNINNGNNTNMISDFSNRHSSAGDDLGLISREVATASSTSSSFSSSLSSSSSMDMHRDVSEEGVDVTNDGFVSFNEYKRWMINNFDSIRGCLVPFVTDGDYTSSKDNDGKL